MVREGLLRHPRRASKRVAEGDHHRVPQAGSPVAPGRGPGRRRGRGALQGGVRRPTTSIGRPRASQGVRPGPFAGTDGGVGGAGGGGTPGGARLQPRPTLGDLLGNLFGAGRGLGLQPRWPVQPGPQRGADLEADLHLSFLDSIQGVTTSVNLVSEVELSRLLGIGRRARHHAPRSVPTAWSGACSTTTRASSRSAVRAPTAAVAASSSTRRARPAPGRASRTRPRMVQGADPRWRA